MAPMKGVRFGKKGKLNPRFIRPFEILEKIEDVAYRLAHPLELSNVHNVQCLSCVYAAELCFRHLSCSQV